MNGQINYQFAYPPTPLSSSSPSSSSSSSSVSLQSFNFSHQSSPSSPSTSVSSGPSPIPPYQNFAPRFYVPLVPTFPIYPAEAGNLHPAPPSIPPVPQSTPDAGGSRGKKRKVDEADIKEFPQGFWELFEEGLDKNLSTSRYLEVYKEIRKDDYIRCNRDDCDVVIKFGNLGRHAMTHFKTSLKCDGCARRYSRTDSLARHKKGACQRQQSRSASSHSPSPAPLPVPSSEFTFRVPETTPPLQSVYPPAVYVPPLGNLPTYGNPLPTGYLWPTFPPIPDQNVVQPVQPVLPSVEAAQANTYAPRAHYRPHVAEQTALPQKRKRMDDLPPPPDHGLPFAASLAPMPFPQPGFQPPEFALPVPLQQPPIPQSYEEFFANTFGAVNSAYPLWSTDPQPALHHQQALFYPPVAYPAAVPAQSNESVNNFSLESLTSLLNSDSLQSVQDVGAQPADSGLAQLDMYSGAQSEPELPTTIDPRLLMMAPPTQDTEQPPFDTGLTEGFDMSCIEAIIGIPAIQAALAAFNSGENND